MSERDIEAGPTRRPEVPPPHVATDAEVPTETIFRIRDLDFFYGSYRAIRDVHMDEIGRAHV